MPSTTKEQRKGSKPPKHWTQNIQDSTVDRAEDGKIHFSVKGGAENGQFIFVSDIKHDKIVIRSGKVHVDEILLEVNGTKVAGFTLWDIYTLFHEYSDQLLYLKCVKAGQPLTKDLRRYLNTRFQKGSIDHDLQQTIRENLYYRTVPCTTRLPREGEINGVDYKFLSPNEFMALEKSGNLLESGIFDGNHYGTPKPPKSPPPESPPSSPLDEKPPSPHAEVNETQNDSRDIVRPGATPSSAGKRQRNKSTIDATTLNSTTVDVDDEDRQKQIKQLEDKYGPLTSNWEISFTEDGDLYYIDHEREVTQWHDPRDENQDREGEEEEEEKEKEQEEEEDEKKSKESEDAVSQDLPYGWERINDPQYGTYFIDHVNRKTQYDSPVKNGTANGQKPGPKFPKTISQTSVEEVKTQPSKEASENGSYYTTSEQEWHHLFTNDPDKLKGKRLRTSLFKSRQGFGFTIIGGDKEDEFLQIKSILPDGPAFEDGKLETGDVLVYVNDRKVLGSTHQDVVTLFQTITPGEKVTLDVCRGYPLPFDPSDPNTNIVTTYAVEPPKSPKDSQGDKEGPSPLPERRNNRSSSVVDLKNHQNGKEEMEPLENRLGQGEGRRHGPRKRKDENNLKHSHAKSLPDLTKKAQMEMENRAKTPTLSINLPYSGDQTPPHFPKPETIVVEFVKGPDGFGFTVADSPYGQKIKQILAPERCKDLQKGDILVEINNDNIQSLAHTEVVKKLKECPQGSKARIVVQRGGYMRSSKPNPRSPQRINQAGPHSPDGIGYPDERGDHRHPPHDRRPHKYQNGKEPFQRDAQRRRSEPPPRSHDGYRPGAAPHSPTGQNSHYNQMTDHLPPNRVDGFEDGNDRMRGRAPQRDPRGYEPDRHSLGGVSLDSHQKRMYYQDRRQPPHLNNHQYRPEDRLSRPQSRGQPHSPGRDAQSHFIESTIFLKKGENGFGFRIVGGTEEGTQVSVANIVNGGAADVDGRLQSGDQILYIDGQSVSGASHSKVVTLMNNAGHIGRVSLGIRRIVPLAPRESSSPTHSRSSQSTIISSAVDALATEVVLTRHESEGFGFVVLSSHMKSGTTIGRITKGSPADRNGWLKVGDHIIAINGIDITNMPHKDIVNLIKDTGLTVSLTVGAREGDPLAQRSPLLKSDRDFTNAQAMPAQVKGGDPSSPTGNQSPRHTLPHNHKPPEPVYAQSSKLRPLQQNRPSDQNPTPNQVPQLTTTRSNPHPQQLTLRSDPGNSAHYPRPAFEKDPRGPSANQLPAYTRPPSVPHSPNRTMQRAEPPRRDQGPMTQPDGAFRPKDQPVGPPMPRRVQDPRAATLGRVPNRYPTNRETGFRPPPERQGDQTQQPGSWIPPGQQRPPMKMTTGQPQYQRDDGRQVYSVELERGPTGFGFSLRGDKEYNTPFYILRMAETGPAARQGMMRVGDQLLRINNNSTENMTYKDAIEFIRTGGNRVSLTLQRLRPTGNNVRHQRPVSLFYHSVRQQRPVSLFYPSDARGTAQTPPPMFHNAPLRNSNTSLQNNQPRARPVDQRQQNADTSWTYRSLPRTMRY
ncbi:membrane-associated guanylate kinase, WW and PDZ domain-containing protein 3-like isoform X5 [Apostichopus japonicus]|uniref:membrane-associated guanylate kinase, WW and PDZ domain-containing protein 3-like isoform X5 n=1 Tax=Stichopus japonicus TaxID=307972 RepID=UPI003AB12A32